MTRRMRFWFSFCVLLCGAVPANAATPTKTPSPTENGSAATAVAKKVDASLLAEVPELKAKAALAVGDASFARRAYIDLVGQWPSPSELTLFVLNPSPTKRTDLVDRLLADQRFGTNWGRYWRDVVLYRRSEDRALITSAVATTFFSEKLNADAPWSDIAREVITATGDLSQVGSTVLVAAQMGDANELAAEVSRIFMGVQISCAQCHDHPTDRWKRQQFHELAAYFPRVAVRPVFYEGRVRGFEAVSRDFNPFGAMMQNVANNPRNRPIEHYMPDLKDPSSQGTLMQPVFFATGAKVEKASRDQDRRNGLVDALTSKENPWFARAFVNRIWSELVGEGFYPGVDDLGPDRPVNAPKTLEILVKDFTDSGYDVKQLYRTIMATEAYRRESRTVRDPNDPPFAANAVRRLRGDQLYDSILIALGMPIETPQVGSFYGNPRGMLGNPRNQFNMTFGFDPSAHRDEIAGSIPQALSLMNSPNLASGLSAQSPSSALSKLLAETKDDRAVATELYLRGLGREPNEQELKLCLAEVREVGNRAEAFEDILWSIINSTEFLYRQ